MTKRNGRSDYLCSSCRQPIGYIRRTAILLRSFTPANGASVKYLEGGILEIRCSCGTATRIHWLTKVI